MDERHRNLYYETENISLRIIVFHLFTEKFLDRLIKSKVKSHSVFTTVRSFDRKLKYVNALDLIESDLYNKLSALNSIRNSHAHNYGQNCLKYLDKVCPLDSENFDENERIEILITELDKNIDAQLREMD